MTADLARLRERLPWIASQMRDSGMYTQATEIESIVPLLTEIEGLRRDAEWAREFKQSQKDAHREGCLLISLRMTKDGKYYECRKVLTDTELNKAENATNGQIVAMVAKLSFGRLMHEIDAAKDAK